MLWEVVQNYVLPPVATVVGVSLSVAIPVGTGALFKWLESRGIEVEESRQRMFQTGIENAAQAVIRRAGKGAITEHLINRGVDYMKGAVPDQIAHFDVSDIALAERVRNRVADKLLRVEGLAPSAGEGDGVERERRVAGRAPIGR